MRRSLGSNWRNQRAGRGPTTAYWSRVAREPPGTPQDSRPPAVSATREKRQPGVDSAEPDGGQIERNRGALTPAPAGRGRDHRSDRAASQPVGVDDDRGVAPGHRAAALELVHRQVDAGAVERPEGGLESVSPGQVLDVSVLAPRVPEQRAIWVARGPEDGPEPLEEDALTLSPLRGHESRRAVGVEPAPQVTREARDEADPGGDVEPRRSSHLIDSSGELSGEIRASRRSTSRADVVYPERADPSQEREPTPRPQSTDACPSATPATRPRRHPRLRRTSLCDLRLFRAPRRFLR